MFRHGCARACPGLEVVGVGCALRVGTGQPTWGHRESGYYRQTLIWPRPGLPSNFRALTRPLTRLSVNAPKRRDAFSTPAFYRHGEQLRVLRRVQPTAMYVSMYVSWTSVSLSLSLSLEALGERRFVRDTHVRSKSAVSIRARVNRVDWASSRVLEG